jgi:hypothetical protein
MLTVGVYLLEVYLLEVYLARVILPTRTATTFRRCRRAVSSSARRYDPPSQPFGPRGLDHGDGPPKALASREFKSNWLNVSIAKMKEPAGPEGEALFFVIHDGADVRSAHFYRTRPAVKGDLVLGTLLICFDHNKKGKVYQAPRDKDNARPGGWWLARITDLSDLDKGYATLAGSYHCAPDALRAIVK